MVESRPDRRAGGRAPGAAALVLVAVAGALALPASASAGGFTITIIGGRRSGQMANLAFPDDLTAIFHNPAGLADQPGLRLHVSTSLTFLQTEFQLQALDPVRWPEINPSGCGTPGRTACPWPVRPDGYYREQIRPEKTFGVLPFLAASADLERWSRRLKGVTVGLAVYAPDFYGAWLPKDAPTAYSLIGGYFLVLSTTAAIGWRPNPYFAVGANVSYNYMRLSFSQKLSVVDALTPKGADPSSLARTGQDLLGDIRMDYTGVDHGVGGGASVLVTPTRWLRFAVGANAATPARFVGRVGFQGLGPAVAGNPDALPAVLESVGYKLPTRLAVEMPIPPSLQAGLGFTPSPRVEIAVDDRLWFYNLYKRQVITPYYDAAQPGQEAVSQDSLSRDKNYRLSFEIGAGALVRPWRRRPDFEVMAGASFDRSPIPDETFTLDNPSLSLIQTGVGARWVMAKRWRLAATYMLFFYLGRDVRTSQTWPPTNAKGRGIAHLPGLEAECVF
jgi:long-subunit fatty acid transport protein